MNNNSNTTIEVGKTDSLNDYRILQKNVLWYVCLRV